MTETLAERIKRLALITSNAYSFDRYEESEAITALLKGDKS